MRKFSINTKAIVPPIEIDIDGVTYPVIRVDRPVIRKMSEYDDRVRIGELDAQYERIEFLLDKPPGTFDFLSPAEVEDLTRYIIKAIYFPDKAMGDDEKNRLTPGSIASKE